MNKSPRHKKPGAFFGALIRNAIDMIELSPEMSSD
jgi:hypothetical protein